MKILRWNEKTKKYKTLEVFIEEGKIYLRAAEGEKNGKPIVFILQLTKEETIALSKTLETYYDHLTRVELRNNGKK